MTPLEINKRVAELKSYTNSYLHAHSPGTPCNKECLKPFYDPYFGKNWVENISDAWDLFEEMPGCLLSKDDETEDGRDIYHCRHREMERGETEWAFELCEAICLAWIKWKEGQNEKVES